MENIGRDFPRRLDFDCFNEIFDVVNADVFVTVIRSTNNLPTLGLVHISHIIEDKSYDENK